MSGDRPRRLPAVLAGVAMTLVVGTFAWWRLGTGVDGGGGPSPDHRAPVVPGSPRMAKRADPATVLPRIGGGGEPAVMTALPPPADHPARRGFFTEAEAAAYVRLGKLEDGDILPDPTPEVAAALAVMQPLFETHVAVPGKGLPTVTPRAVRAIGPVDPALDRRCRELQRRLATAAPGDGIPEERRCELVAVPGDIALVGEYHHRLEGPGVWAAVPRPAGRELRLDVAGDHPYAVRFDGEGVDRIRLDGGLVLPGRYYDLGEGATITGDAAVHVLVRPLSAVPAYYPRPLTPPKADA